MPPVYNHKTIDYKGASKNWDLSTNRDGELFVANNNGLLYYNGEEWKLYKLPNNTIIRSVLSHNERIYTGSYEEFGYWEKNDKGLLEYNSLTHLIKNYVFTSEEFWEILAYKDKIIFRSFSSIYIYQNDEIKVIEAIPIISDIVEYNDKIIVAGSNRGLFELQGEDLVPLANQIMLYDKMVTDMTVMDEKILIGTKLNGCFIYSETQKLQPWTSALDDDLKKHQLNKIVSVNSEKIVFGTIKNGIYIYDIKSGTSENLNKQLGLQNNTILSMLYFDEQLWLGLDNGIDFIKLNNPVLYYTDNSGILGTVYDIVDRNGNLYLGSNTGAYRFNENHLEFIDGTQGHVWDLVEIGDELFCGHNSATYKISDSKVDVISNIAGGYDITRIPEKEFTYIQGTYNGLAKFHKNDSGTWEARRINGIDFPIKQLCFEDANTLWGVHPYKGLYRMKINELYNNVTAVKEFGGEGIPNDYNVSLYNIKNQIIFNSKGLWYKYDPILDKIIPFKEFKSFRNKKLLFYEDNYFWFANTEDRKEIIFTNLKSDSLIINYPQLQERFVPEAQKIIKKNDSIFMITLSDGYAEINLTKLKNQLVTFKLPSPKLSAFRDEVQLYPTDQNAKQIPYKNSQNIVIKMTSPTLAQARYYYDLKGRFAKSGYLDRGVLNFQNLPYGDYELNVSSVSIDNKISEPNTVVFKIAPPWYLSKFSLFCYFLCALGGIYLVRVYNKRKLRSKQLQLQKQMQRAQHKRILEVEKEKLAKEIKLKQNELTSTTLNIAKKNEVILELKEMLIDHKDKFSNSQRYRAFLKKLDKSVKDSDDWKRFEFNFKELHEDFFERLLKQYPKLTPKDLKLSAYLKMNLSSKEIAPLMGITIRGVEIHRYRLRKKLKIDTSENLSNFLITF